MNTTLFEDVLTECLYDLDGEAYADAAGESGKSRDRFLYARCYVVAAGEKFYEKVEDNPSKMPTSIDEWCEPLLYAACRAWAEALRRQPWHDADLHRMSRRFGEVTLSRTQSASGRCVPSRGPECLRVVATTWHGIPCLVPLHSNDTVVGTPLRWTTPGNAAILSRRRPAFKQFGNRLMKVPSALFGTDRDVKKRSAGVLRRIAAGAPLMEAVAEAPSLETSDTEGLLLLGNPGEPASSDQNHVFYVLQAQMAEAIVDKRIDSARAQALFDECLGTAWSTLGMMSMMVGAIWTSRHPERAWNLLHAYERHWSTFVAEGPRYSSDLVTGGKELWEVPSFLGPVLAYCGVPDDVLRERLFREGLPPLLKYVRRPGPTGAS